MEKIKFAVNDSNFIKNINKNYKINELMLSNFKCWRDLQERCFEIIYLEGTSFTTEDNYNGIILDINFETEPEYDLLFLPSEASKVKIIPVIYRSDVWSGKIHLFYKNNDISFEKGDVICNVMCVRRTSSEFYIKSKDQFKTYNYIPTRVVKRFGLIFDNIYEITCNRLVKIRSKKNVIFRRKIENKTI